MNTSKPISTISFNTKAFLISELDELIDSKHISFYAFIKHYAEPQECNDTLKDHFHVYIEPNTRIDTMALQSEFKEPVKSSEFPLGCLPFSLSKFPDWYYYSLHNPIYLANKGMSRKFFYAHDDIITNEPDYLKEKVNGINLLEFNYYIDMASYQDKGYHFNQYVIAKNINPMQIKAYFMAWGLVEEIRRASTHKEEADDLSSHLLDKDINIDIPKIICKTQATITSNKE